MRKTYITAGAIALAFLGWMMTGQFGAPERTEPATLAELNSERGAVLDDRVLTRVRARISQAEPRISSVIVRGRTENKRTVTVKAEASGRIVERRVEKGSRVETGDLLCRIATEDRDARLVEAQEAVNQARIEYEGRRKLADQGLVSETVNATSKAKLAAARALLKRRQVDLANTQVRAPFDGLIEATPVAIGDFVQPGAACATVIDLDPMLMIGRVAERSVHQLGLGAQATGTLIDGREVSGTVSFIGQQSDAATRTYAVEVEVPNPDYQLRSGVTTQIRIPVATLMAHQLSPSLLALDDTGRIGVRTLDAENRVQFKLVDILDDDEGSVWVAGLAPITTVITVGQELVVPGEEVEVVLESEDPEGTGTGMIGAVPDPETADTQRNSQAHTPS